MAFKPKNFSEIRRHSSTILSTKSSNEAEKEMKGQQIWELRRSFNAPCSPNLVNSINVNTAKLRYYGGAPSCWNVKFSSFTFNKIREYGVDRVDQHNQMVHRKWWNIDLTFVSAMYVNFFIKKRTFNWYCRSSLIIS